MKRHRDADLKAFKIADQVNNYLFQGVFAVFYIFYFVLLNIHFSAPYKEEISPTPKKF